MIPEHIVVLIGLVLMIIIPTILGYLDFQGQDMVIVAIVLLIIIVAVVVSGEASENDTSFSLHNFEFQHNGQTYNLNSFIYTHIQGTVGALGAGDDGIEGHTITTTEVVHHDTASHATNQNLGTLYSGNTQYNAITNTSTFSRTFKGSLTDLTVTPYIPIQYSMFKINVSSSTLSNYIILSFTEKLTTPIYLYGTSQTVTLPLDGAAVRFNILCKDGVDKGKVLSYFIKVIDFKDPHFITNEPNYVS